MEDLTNGGLNIYIASEPDLAHAIDRKERAYKSQTQLPHSTFTLHAHLVRVHTHGKKSLEVSRPPMYEKSIVSPNVHACVP